MPRSSYALPSGQGTVRRANGIHESSDPHDAFDFDDEDEEALAAGAEDEEDTMRLNEHSEPQAGSPEDEDLLEDRTMLDSVILPILASVRDSSLLRLGRTEFLVHSCSQE